MQYVLLCIYLWGLHLLDFFVCFSYNFAVLVWKHLTQNICAPLEEFFTSTSFIGRISDIGAILWTAFNADDIRTSLGENSLTLSHTTVAVCSPDVSAEENIRT